MILCTSCNNTKDENNFSLRSKKSQKRHTVCKECHKKLANKHYRNNKEKYLEKSKEWVEKNKNKRKAVCKAYAARKYGYPECRCCSRDEILRFYERCPQGYQVDHIKTRTHGGTHCIKNLQYLTPSVHSKKSCKERWRK